MKKQIHLKDLIQISVLATQLMKLAIVFIEFLDEVVNYGNRIQKLRILIS